MKRPPGTEMRDRARNLRRQKTEAEKLLWRFLRGRRSDGFKFRDEMWLCGFIADFACVEGKLIVEADGGQHRFAKEYDERRSAAFAAHGYRTLRFTNDEILGGLDPVLANIRDALPSPSHRFAAGPSLSPEGRGEAASPAATPLPVGEREGPKPSGLGG